MDDRLSPDDRTGGNGGGQGSAAGGGNNDNAMRGGGNNRGGRVNTSAWIIGALVVIIAVFAGLRYARVPAPSRPAPTRPAPTQPAPTPTPTRPAPTAPAATTADLERDLTRVEDAVRRKDWAAADRESTKLRTTWESLRSRVTSTNTTKDVTAFDARMDKLRADIKAKNEAGARADITELKSIARRFKISPTRGPTSG
ncbi:MAG: DUF4363 family protein [Bacillota bacterium]|nr:DUF4363 family protein [Bacillota bacterium]